MLVQYQRLGSYSIYYVQVTKNKVFSNVVIIETALLSDLEKPGSYDSGFRVRGLY